MSKIHTHCQCDCCSGEDCGQDDPDKFTAEQDAIQKAHDDEVRKAERENHNDELLTKLVQELASTWRIRDSKLFAIIRKYRIVPIGAMRSEQP